MGLFLSDPSVGGIKMELTEQEKANWIKFKSSYKPSKDQTERNKKIVEMCKNGASRKEIKEACPGNNDDINRIIMKARKEGAY